MIEWEKVSDSEPWSGTYYTSARLKVYGGWLVNTTISDIDIGKIPHSSTTTFVSDTHHFWTIEDTKTMEFLHESEC